MDQVFGVSKYKPNKSKGYWDELTISDEASKYDNRTDFQKGSQVAYQKAYRLGMLDYLFPVKKEYTKKWTLDKSIETAQNYKGSRTQFYRDYPVAYRQLINKGLLDNYFDFRPDRESDENVILRAKEYGTLKNLRVNNVALYHKLTTRGLMGNVFPKEQRNIPMDNATKKEIIDKAKQYNTRSDLFRNDRRLFERLKKIENGLDLVFGKMGEDTEYKKQDWIKRAKIYDNKYDLKRLNFYLYKKIESLGLMNQVFPTSEI